MSTYEVALFNSEIPWSSTKDYTYIKLVGADRESERVEFSDSGHSYFLKKVSLKSPSTLLFTSASLFNVRMIVTLDNQVSKDNMFS